MRRRQQDGRLEDPSIAAAPPGPWWQRRPRAKTAIIPSCRCEYRLGQEHFLSDCSVSIIGQVARPVAVDAVVCLNGRWLPFNWAPSPFLHDHNVVCVGAAIHH
jgi:hypothetical protein